MADQVTLEQVEALAAQLPEAERVRLAQKILQESPTPTGASEGGPPYDWMALRGIAPDLMEGEDAQEWVTRTRREGDERRERQWRPTT